MINVDEDYSVEVTCTYKGETYHVRDNGAVFRVQKGVRKRQYDGFWTFGLKHIDNGYMYIAQEVVHRIVATAFHGEPKDKNLVVDHIDTNRANNRPENLRWVTKLENALGNPITRAKIIYVCGSIENFLKDPSMLFNAPISDKNFRWMRTVSKEEAKVSRKRLEEWAKETPEQLEQKVKKAESGIDEWVFQPRSAQKHYTDKKIDNNISDSTESSISDSEKIREKKSIFDSELPHESQKLNVGNGNAINPDKDSSSQIVSDPKPVFTVSLTPNAKQENWYTPTVFPLCPTTLSIEDYYNNIKIGAIFSKNTRKTGTVVDKEWFDEGKAFIVLAKDDNAINPWMPSLIYVYDGFFIHYNAGAWHFESIARKKIKELRGEEVVYTDDEDIFM